jgi:hypothetical protein
MIMILATGLLIAGAVNLVLAWTARPRDNGLLLSALVCFAVSSLVSNQGPLYLRYATSSAVLIGSILIFANVGWSAFRRELPVVVLCVLSIAAVGVTILASGFSRSAEIAGVVLFAALTTAFLITWLWRVERDRRTPSSTADKR